jgi:hypothetical protein
MFPQVAQLYFLAHKTLIDFILRCLGYEYTLIEYEHEAASLYNEY